MDVNEQGQELTDEADWVPIVNNDEAQEENVEDNALEGDNDVVEEQNREPPLANAELNERMALMAARRRQAQDVHSRMSKNRFFSYVVLSLGGALLHIYWAFCTRQQFYLAVVYMTSSKFAYVTMGNACICLTVILFWCIVNITLGGLRNVEQEAIGEGLRWGLMETCLAITIFRQEVDRHMVFLFLALVLAKSLHWAAEYRGLHVQQAEMMHAHDELHEHVLHQDEDEICDEEQRQESKRKKVLLTAKWFLNILRGFKKQIGFLTLSYLLLFLDLWAVVYCATVCATTGPSVHILFGFEAAILFISATNILSTHWVHWWDNTFYASRHKTWHGRGTITFALEVAFEGCKFVFYLIFFAIVFTYYGMPINIFRDLYMSYTNLKRKVSSFVKYRQLTSNMNARFENATEEELEASGRTCIICRDDITTSSGNPGKKLPCSHIFHFYCLREWLQQQQSCPTCRSEIPASWSKAKKDAAAAAAARANADAANNANADAATDGNSESATNANAVAAADSNAEQQITEGSHSDNLNGESGRDGGNNPAKVTDNAVTLGTQNGVDSSAATATPSSSTIAKRRGGEGDDGNSKDGNSKIQANGWLLGGDGDGKYEETDPFPSLYRVLDVAGAKVFEKKTDTWEIVRTVEAGKTIICTKLEWMQGGQCFDTSTGKFLDEKISSQMMLRMPDGWISEKGVERLPIPLSLMLDAT